MSKGMIFKLLKTKQNKKEKILMSPREKKKHLTSNKALQNSH